MTHETSINAGLRALLEQGIHEGAFGIGGAWVAEGGRQIGTAFTSGANATSMWDVASLTKPMAIVTEVMRRVASRALSLDDRVTHPAGLNATIRDLLAHRSSLPAWDDLWAVAEGLEAPWTPGSPQVIQAISERIGALSGTQKGTRYSDLGFIALGWHLERHLGQTLEQLVDRWCWSAPAERAIPTGHCHRRGHQSVGEVDDLNCWVLGGVAGHAGLFATLDEVGRWALDLANSAANRGGTIDGGVIREFWDLGQRQDSTWVLGWDTPTPPNSTAGRRASLDSVGHLGFTGTSVWIDRGHDLVMVLLTDRVALGPDSKPIMRAFRPRFHDGIRDLVGR